jgi:hypothetical protein
MRCLLVLALLLSPFAAPPALRADAFDNYTNDLLAKVPKAEGTQALKEITDVMLVDNERVLPGLKPAFLVVKTNEGRWCKLLVQIGQQKLPDKTRVPVLAIERFVTYKEGEERQIVADGRNVRLFPDFHFSLDLGQVVPATVGGDIVLVADGDKVHVAPLGKAELYLVTKHLPEANPKKADKVIVGGTFEPKYFNGTYQLYDDGRRSGKLVLKVDAEGEVTGAYYSDKDGKKYDIAGKIGDANHTIKFTVQLPQVLQEFHGWMFTGDGRVISGYSRLLERELGFYAVRIEEK